ncbi:hypothetical protein PQG02_18165 [Nostoc sp. UHCC 0926]|uniref:hypothetical protein n=1 Tax=Nostoc sp. UHCC 0926 TaxID=3025190 RepID=UPI002361C93E|nr:hypothetical protein [Nostoc sp. UHCC 0926]WDD30682.1 hypothetical protein PQG02_18165 [Nostoc sp. UHCC 0926]
MTAKQPKTVRLRSAFDKRRFIEEPDEVKVSRPVLKTNGVGDNLVEFTIETNFAKTFLLAVSLVEDFSKPLIIAAIVGKENVVFCNLYDAATKTRIRSEWNRDADWLAIIDSVQTKLQTSKNSHIVSGEPILF